MEINNHIIVGNMNKVMLIGNVGRDPDVRYYDADQAVAQVSLATTEKGYMLANGTQVPDRTDWHSLVFYRSLAKIVEKFVHKGDKLYVEGKVRYRVYDDKQGKRHNITEIYVDNMEMLTPKNYQKDGVNSRHGNDAIGMVPSVSVSSVSVNDGAMKNGGSALKIQNNDSLPF